MCSKWISSLGSSGGQGLGPALTNRISYGSRVNGNEIHRDADARWTLVRRDRDHAVQAKAKDVAHALHCWRRQMHLSYGFYKSAAARAAAP